MTATLTPAKLMTAKELLVLPSNHMRHELVRGELHTMAPPGSEHGYVAGNVSSPLIVHVKAHGLGVVLVGDPGFLISRDPDTVRAPDVAFVKKERIPAEGIPKGYFPGPPDLAVEIVSPNDTMPEVEDKVLDWLEAGTALVWVVNPTHQRVTVYRSLTNIAILKEQDWLEGSAVIPGFRYQVKDMFG